MSKGNLSDEQIEKIEGLTKTVGNLYEENKQFKKEVLFIRSKIKNC